MFIIDRDVVFNSKDNSYSIDNSRTRINLLTTEYPTVLKSVTILFLSEPQSWRYYINVATIEEREEKPLMLLSLKSNKDQYTINCDGMPRLLPPSAVFFIKKTEFSLTVPLQLIITINEQVPFNKSIV